jgi:hypothetical protein
MAVDQNQILSMALRHQLIHRWQIEECERMAREAVADGIEPILSLMQSMGYLHPVEIGAIQEALLERDAEIALAEAAIKRGWVSLKQVLECSADLGALVRAGRLTAEQANQLRATSSSTPSASRLPRAAR